MHHHGSRRYALCRLADGAAYPRSAELPRVGGLNLAYAGLFLVYGAQLAYAHTVIENGGASTSALDLQRGDRIELTAVAKEMRPHETPDLR